MNSEFRIRLAAGLAAAPAAGLAARLAAGLAARLAAGLAAGLAGGSPASLSVSQFSQFSSVQFSYAMKQGGPELGRRRLYAAQGGFRGGATGGKGPRALHRPSNSGLCATLRLRPGASGNRGIAPSHFSSVQFSQSVQS